MIVQAVLLLWIFCLVDFGVCLCYAVLSDPCSLVVTCWKLADLLALLCVVFVCALSLSHMCVDHIRTKDETCLSPPVIFTDRSKEVLLLWIFCLVGFDICLCYSGFSVPCSLVVTCREMADLFALLCVVFACVLSLSPMCLDPHQN